MKKTYILLFIMGMVILSGCTTGNTAQNNVQTVSAATNVHEATFEIKDMYCPSCALGVEYQWKELGGVIDAKVNYEEGKGVVKYDADKINPEAIAQASDVYKATVVKDIKMS